MSHITPITSAYKPTNGLTPKPPLPYLLIPEKDILGSIKADMINNILNSLTVEEALSIAIDQLTSHWCYGDKRAAKKHYEEARKFLTEYLIDTDVINRILFIDA